MSQIHLGAIEVEVVLKNIKNLHLRVLPPAGRVRISAPRRMSIERIRSFVLSKLEWIKKQQVRVREQERETPQEYVDGEGHCVWGRRYLLSVLENEGRPAVELTPTHLILRVRPRTGPEGRRALLGAWCRAQVEAAAQPLFLRWQPRMGVKVERCFVRQMKTRWGSCNYRTRTIRLNTELARRPPESLEYVVVHELVHLLEPTHNARFVALMDRFMPDWRIQRKALKRLPVAREEGSGSSPGAGGHRNSEVEQAGVGASGPRPPPG